MIKITKIASLILGVFVLLLGLVYVNGLRDTKTLGSIQDGQAYTSTTTDSTYAGSSRYFRVATTSAGVTTNNTVSGTLGSVIITGTSATVVEIKDATSTTDVGSTTLAIFAASPATGTYTFDSAYSRGLMVNFLGSFAGKYTFTYR